MSRLDWEKARERDRTRQANQPAEPSQAGARQRAARQVVLARFVETHQIGCFKCGATKAEWAKTGISKRGPWAICARCASES